MFLLLAGLCDLNALSPEEAEKFRLKEVQVFDGCARLFSKPYTKDMEMWEMCMIERDELVGLKDKQKAYEVCLAAMTDWHKNVEFAKNLIRKTNVDTLIVHKVVERIWFQMFLIDVLAVRFESEKGRFERVSKNHVFRRCSARSLSLSWTRCQRCYYRLQRLGKK